MSSQDQAAQGQQAEQPTQSPTEKAQALFDGLEASFDDIVAADTKHQSATASRVAAETRVAQLKDEEEQALSAKDAAKAAFAEKTDGMIDNLRQLKELAASI